VHCGCTREASSRRRSPNQSRAGRRLVRVHAAAITRNELTWPTDRLPAIPSYELSGVVEASGDEIIALTPFDRDGVAAGYAVVPERCWRRSRRA
jgi:NADPH:quinone reductase-like Zn-dependent oxidoreductase